VIILEDMRPTLLKEMGKVICQCTREAWGHSKEPSFRSLPKTPKGSNEKSQVDAKSTKGGKNVTNRKAFE